jgi:hypothetical protein
VQACYYISRVLLSKTPMDIQFHRNAYTSNQDKRKRVATEDLRADSSSDSDEGNANPDKNARFYVMEAASEASSLSSLSSFAEEKLFKAKVRSVAVHNLRSGSLLIETDNVQYKELLLKITDMGGIPVQVSPHRTLSSCKGVIKCRELALVSSEEIKAELAAQGMTDVFKTTYLKDGLRLPGSTLI